MYAKRIVKQALPYATWHSLGTELMVYNQSINHFLMGLVMTTRYAGGGKGEESPGRMGEHSTPNLKLYIYGVFLL